MSFGHYQDGSLTPRLFEEFKGVCDTALANGQLLVTGHGPYVPQAYRSVIVAGKHSENTSGSTNEGDVRAPGILIPVIDNTNHRWLDTGTSFSTAHLSALFALQLEALRKENFGPSSANHIYHWALTRASVIESGGRIYAAQSEDGTGPLGALDLMKNNWPFGIEIEYTHYTSTTPEGYPIFYNFETMYQDITLTNISNIAYSETDIVSTTMAASQHDHNTGQLLPGESTKTHNSSYIFSGHEKTFENTYYVPGELEPGVYHTNLAFEFRSSNCPHTAEMANDEVSLWCPPGPRPQSGYGTKPPPRRR
jgi:hypothetical protein